MTMATQAKHIPLCFFFLLFASVSFHQAEARMFQFFSTTVRSAQPSPATSPGLPHTSQSRVERSDSTTEESRGYGLYGRVGTRHIPYYSSENMASTQQPESESPPAGQQESHTTPYPRSNTPVSASTTQYVDSAAEDYDPLDDSNVNIPNGYWNEATTGSYSGDARRNVDPSTAAYNANRYRDPAAATRFPYSGYRTSDVVFDERLTERAADATARSFSGDGQASGMSDTRRIFGGRFSYHVDPSRAAMYTQQYGDQSQNNGEYHQEYTPQNVVP